MSRPLFAGHMLGSPPMKRKKNLQQMIIITIGCQNILFGNVQYCWKLVHSIGIVSDIYRTHKQTNKKQELLTTHMLLKQ